jgi:hypothetical protein
MFYFLVTFGCFGKLWQPCWFGRFGTAELQGLRAFGPGWLDLFLHSHLVEVVPLY